jgi:hypothetical protein
MLAFQLIGLRAVTADIPAHCLQTDVLGTWSFKVGAPISDPTSVQQKCDQLDPLPYGLDITLSAPNHAADDVGNVGNWVCHWLDPSHCLLPAGWPASHP